MKRIALAMLLMTAVAAGVFLALNRPGAEASPDATIAAASADLKVTKTVDNPAPNEGDSVTYTIVVENNGPSDATSVEVDDTLPPGVTYVSHLESTGSYHPGIGLWLVGSLPYGGSRTLWITGTVDSGTGGTTIWNTAQIGADQSDPDPTDNLASESITVASTPTPTPTPTPSPTATATATAEPTPPAELTRTLDWEPGWHNDSWSGPDNTAPQDVFACAQGSYAAAYRYVSGAFQRYIPDRPDISNMEPLNQYDPFLILVTAPVSCSMPIAS